MSLWLRKRGSDGKAHYYTIPFDLFVLVSVVGIVAGLAVTVQFTFCELTHRQLQPIA